MDRHHTNDTVSVSDLFMRGLRAKSEPSFIWLAVRSLAHSLSFAVVAVIRLPYLASS